MFVSCCAGFLARADRAQPSTMPVPPPPAPPPPPTLALVSFTRGKWMHCSLLLLVTLNGMSRDTEVWMRLSMISGESSPIYYIVYGWSLILQEGPLFPLPSSSYVDVTIHSNSPSFYSSHIGGWSGGKTTACLRGVEVCLSPCLSPNLYSHLLPWPAPVLNDLSWKKTNPIV